jgi:hypothetical protein
MWYTRDIFLFFLINWTLRMSDNLPERVQILGHVHILCITVRDNIIICCQIFCDLLLKSAFEQIFNVMQLISVKITWHIKWKYLIQKFHDIYLSYYFKTKYWKWWFGLWCLHATFNNISAISWQSVLLVEETGALGENHLSQVTYKLYHIMLHQECLAWAGFELTLVMISTDCISGL